MAVVICLCIHIFLIYMTYFRYCASTYNGTVFNKIDLILITLFPWFFIILGTVVFYQDREKHFFKLKPFYEKNNNKHNNGGFIDMYD